RALTTPPPARQDDARESRGYPHPDRLRDDDRAPSIEPVDDHACHQTEDAERDELAGGEEPRGEGGVRKREREPRLGDLVDPRAALRDRLAEEVEPVVPMHAQARERTP